MSAILKQKLIDIANGFTKYGLWKGGNSVEWAQIITSGTKIAKITIDGTQTDVYAPTGGGGGVSSISYSTEEQVIGTWIDGKPLYQKTVIYDITTTSDFVSIPLNITYPNFIMIYDFTLVDGNTFYGLAQPYSYYRIIDKSSFYLKLTMNNWAGGTTAYITVRYTKTTD